MNATPQQQQQSLQTMQGLIQNSGVPPQIIAQFGRLAKEAIKDKTLYPMFVQQLERQKLIDPGELGPGINYQALAIFAAMGKMAERMGVTQ